MTTLRLVNGSSIPLGSSGAKDRTLVRKHGAFQGVRCPRLRKIITMASATPSLVDTFSRLLDDYDVYSKVAAQPCALQHGIFSSVPVKTGEVLLRVPLEHCLVLDYNQGGLKLPAAGSWPRVQQALEKDNALPWDLLQAVALVDGLAGDGGEFWYSYCNEVLPQPLQLSLPLALPRNLLFDLEHPAIIQGALLQKERLQVMFPGWSKPIQEGFPTWIQWGFACVRSRAFKLRGECFAFVPFLDVANYSGEANANFLISSTGDTVELVALRDIGTGEEVTVSYDGKEGLTNRRFMAQYGFVPEEGNMYDRIDLSSVTASEEHSDRSHGLLLSHMQDLLGDMLWMGMMKGDNPYMYATLKSVPWLAEDDAASYQLAATQPLAQDLLAVVTTELSGYSTSLQDDLRLMFRADIAADCRAQAIVRYRYERKKLLQAAQVLLKAYCRGRMDMEE